MVQYFKSCIILIVIFVSNCNSLHNNMETFEIHGLVAPVFTAFKEDGTLDINKIAEQASWLNSTGVKWVFTSGSTGESVDLTVDERKLVATEWVKIAPKYDMQVIVHVGTDSVIDAIDMAQHAENIGAQVVAAMPPTYIKPLTVNALVQTIKAIANAAPSIPFYYYHIPSCTGVDFLMSDFVAAADEEIPNLRGIKYTHYALDDLQLTLAYTFKSGPSWRKGFSPNILFGRDQFLLAALSYGVEGAVGTTYNFNAELQRQIIDAFNKGDLETARNAQKGTASFVKYLDELAHTLNGAYSWKIIMKIIGNDVGPARLPYIPPTPAAEEALKSMLIKWCNELSVDLQTSWCKRLIKKEEKK